MVTGYGGQLKKLMRKREYLRKMCSGIHDGPLKDKRLKELIKFSKTIIEYLKIHELPKSRYIVMAKKTLEGDLCL